MTWWRDGRVLARRTAVVLLAAAAVAVGVRELIHSPYQIVGESILRVETTEKVVALTFDDGPDRVRTPRMLDLLDRHRVTATFFMMGRQVERHPDIARMVIARGHEVGNHSYSHPKLIFMSPRRVREEIERTDALLRGIGASGELHFRPPHGARFLILPYILGQMDKRSVLTDVDPEEWRRPSAAVMTATVLRDVRPGSIIGYHEILGDETYRSVDEVLTALVADGYRFETVSALITRRSR